MFPLLASAAGTASVALLSLMRNIGEFPVAAILVVVGSAGLLLGLAGLVQTRGWPKRTPAKRSAEKTQVRRDPSPPRTQQAAPRAAPVPPRADTDRIRVAFPAIEPRHPDVWAPPDPLDVAVEVGPGLVPPQSAATIELVAVSEGTEWPIGRVAPDDARRARFTVDPAALRLPVSDAGGRGGEAHLVARLEVDGRRAGQAVRGVRFVPYREEIVETFEDFMKWASAQYAFVDRRMTAREFVDRFADAVPGTPIAPLERIVDTYELANYSDHPVDRSLYLDFVEAFLELEDAGSLEGPGGGAL